ncbi:MAG: HNH endonuclease signature motif containing protein, partial [Actinomycetota bacterium]
LLVYQHTMSRVIAHAGLGSATSLTGNSIDPFTGLPMANDALEDLLGEPGDFLERRCETDTGVPLRPTDVLRSLLSGRLRRVVLGAERQVVDLGRSSRVFTGAARDAATLLAITCDHPGCDVPADWCQVDHSTEWHELGPTDQANAGVECRHHNVDKHRRRRRTRRAGDGRMYTFRPDGTIMLPVGCRPPRFDPDGDDPDDHHDGATNGDPTEADVRYLADMARARLAVALARR